MTFMQKLFSFEGRLRRQDFWICNLILWGVGVVAYIILMMIFGGSMVAALGPLQGADPNDPATAAQAATAMAAMGPFYAACGVLWLAMLWPALAIDIKRLHD